MMMLETFELDNAHLSALSHYNVSDALFRRMKGLSNMLAYAEIELKTQKEASFWTHA